MTSNVRLTPPGGWKYYEERTKITLMADTYENLVKHMKSHRKSNAIVEGNVEADLEEQMSKKQV